MTRQRLLYFLVTFLTALVVFLTFKNYQIDKENHELLLLLNKTIVPIDIANRKMHEDVNKIRNLDYEEKFPELTKRVERIDSIYKLYKFNPEIDSSGVIELVKNMLMLNDTFKSYFGKYPICIDNLQLRLLTNEYFSHDNKYNYGDTITIIFEINQHLIGNFYEIIDFDNKELGTKENNIITYKIPTRQLFRKTNLPKEAQFNFKVIIRNLITNELETLENSKTFTVDN